MSRICSSMMLLISISFLSRSRSNLSIRLRHYFFDCCKLFALYSRKEAADGSYSLDSSWSGSKFLRRANNFSLLIWPISFAFAVMSLSYCSIMSKGAFRWPCIPARTVNSCSRETSFEVSRTDYIGLNKQKNKIIIVRVWRWSMVSSILGLLGECLWFGKTSILAVSRYLTYLFRHTVDTPELLLCTPRSQTYQRESQRLSSSHFTSSQGWLWDWWCRRRERSVGPCSKRWYRVTKYRTFWCTFVNLRPGGTWTWDCRLLLQDWGSRWPSRTRWSWLFLLRANRQYSVISDLCGRYPWNVVGLSLWVGRARWVWPGFRKTSVYVWACSRRDPCCLGSTRWRCSS